MINIHSSLLSWLMIRNLLSLMYLSFPTAIRLTSSCLTQETYKIRKNDWKSFLVYDLPSSGFTDALILASLRR